MHHLFRLTSWILAGSILGCYQPTYDVSGSGGFVEDYEEEGGTASEPTPPTSTSSGNKPSQQHDDEGFDPCPEVTYELWRDENGVIYEVTMEVFCEPIQNMNLGCPGP